MHAAASPSSAGMWMNCPASITKAEGRERPASRFAKEGTAAHRISEIILNGDIFPPGKITVEGTEFIVGIPMLKALRPYIDLVEGLRARPGSTTHLEQKVVLGWSGGWVWGTADCVSTDGYTLDVADLKFGRGVPVSPDAAQLKIYALAAWETFWPNAWLHEVNLTIVQPRLDPQPKTFAMTGRELQDWKARELQPAVGRIVGGDETENAGPWCRWCVRTSECVAFARKRSDAAAESFNDGIALPV
jgi:Protein of unknown function (DUF2800)